MKTAPALHLARKGKDELEMKTKETTLEPGRTGSADARPWPPLRREAAQKEKKALGVGVSP